MHIYQFCILNETLVSCKTFLIVCRMMLWIIYRQGRRSRGGRMGPFIFVLLYYT